ncbi:hypothetical protein AIOGIFDO_00879 [Candidatus Methanoperedenaceae archaeon GB37]|nr:hypothetical protein AIOGIFDO_00879 [Candidatus Methanoperedenaceae archaeon GB37]
MLARCVVVWSVIEERFRGYPGREKVVKFLLEHGLQVNERGHVGVDGVEIPHLQIGERVGVDRRVVDATCAAIRRDPLLAGIFENIRTIHLLRDVAPSLGLRVIVVKPDDARQTGLLGEVAMKVAEFGISIRQAVSDDPYLVAEPLLTIIVEGSISGGLVEELVRIPGVKGVTIY